MSEDYTTSEYWNDRTRRGIERGDFKNMIFEDRRFDIYAGRVREMLALYKNLKVADVACGYGRFADIFTRYTGFDFSEEMINLAKEKHPHHSFQLLDIKTQELPEQYDFVFEVNSLHSLGMTPEEFYQKFAKHAHKLVGCFEADYFIIFQKYA